MPSAPNRRKRGNVLDSIFSDSQPLPLNEYVKLITKGQIDLLTSPATETEAKAEAGDEENRKEQERREYIQSVFIVPEAQPVILDVLQNDPTPINDVDSIPRIICVLRMKRLTASASPASIEANARGSEDAIFSASLRTT